MGQPAYSNGIAQFNDIELASKAHEKFLEFVDKADKKAFKNEELNGDYGIVDVKWLGHQITYTVDSSRYQNCVWQCEQILEFFKLQPGIVEVQQDVLTSENSVSWAAADDE